MSPARLRRSVRLLGFALVAILAAGAVTAGLAVAKRHHGPKIVAPHKGHVYKVGSRIHFKVRDHSRNAKKYQVWLTVRSKKRVTKHGVLKKPGSNTPGTFSSMKRHKHGLYTYTPPHYTFPQWFMQRPGKYYWQAFHIDCSFHPCEITSRISSFRVVR